MRPVTELNADQLVEQACATAGTDDFGADSWRVGLDQLVASLNDEARLNELGGAIVAGELTGYLTDRLGIVAYRKAHPEMVGVEFPPPIVIVGQGRTGTTILFDLLAQDPQNRVPLTWEVDRPLPPPETATYETDPRIEEVDAVLAGVDMVMPGFRAMHPMGARLAQECVRITSSDFRSMIFPTQYRVPSYTEWLLQDADMASAYRWHRTFLEHLQSRHPAERWVWKSPGHIWCLDALLAEYPDALLIQTHRDPLRIVASLGSLVSTLRGMSSDDTSIPEAAEEFGNYIIDGLNRSVDARENGVVDPKRVVDVQFADFMADPFATIRRAYDILGFELTADAETRMRAFLADNPQNKFGRHTYTWDATELDLGAWRERTARYQNYFDVPSESV